MMMVDLELYCTRSLKQQSHVDM